MVRDELPSPIIRVPAVAHPLDPADPLQVSLWMLTVGLPLMVPLPDVATDALVRGIDSPSLRQLAGIRDDDVWECDRLWADTIDELDLDTPDAHTARWWLILAIASDIVTGRIDPSHGAEDIDDLIDHNAPDMEGLIIFTGLRWSWAEGAQPHERTEQQIREAAGDLLRGRPSTAAHRTGPQ